MENQVFIVALTYNEQINYDNIQNKVIAFDIDRLKQSDIYLKVVILSDCVEIMKLQRYGIPASDNVTSRLVPQGVDTGLFQINQNTMRSKYIVESGLVNFDVFIADNLNDVREFFSEDLVNIYSLTGMDDVLPISVLDIQSCYGLRYDSSIFETELGIQLKAMIDKVMVSEDMMLQNLLNDMMTEEVVIDASVMIRKLFGSELINKLPVELQNSGAYIAFMQRYLNGFNYKNVDIPIYIQYGLINVLTHDFENPLISYEDILMRMCLCAREYHAKLIGIFRTISGIGLLNVIYTGQLVKGDYRSMYSVDDLKLIDTVTKILRESESENSVVEAVPVLVEDDSQTKLNQDKLSKFLESDDELPGSSSDNKLEDCHQMKRKDSKLHTTWPNEFQVLGLDQILTNDMIYNASQNVGDSGGLLINWLMQGLVPNELTTMKMYDLYLKSQLHLDPSSVTLYASSAFRVNKNDLIQLSKYIAKQNSDDPMREAVICGSMFLALAMIERLQKYGTLLFLTLDGVEMEVIIDKGFRIVKLIFDDGVSASVKYACNSVTLTSLINSSLSIVEWNELILTIFHRATKSLITDFNYVVVKGRIVGITIE